MHSKVLLSTFMLVISVKTLVDSQIVFEEKDTNQQHKPQQHDRQPVASKKCQEGELLYPGDNNADWACDCRPTYLYYPATLRCYEAYTGGPCKQNEILVLPKAKKVPVCDRSNCEFGKVKFNNVCAKIGSFEACRQPSKGVNSHFLQINATTLQLNCVGNFSPSRVTDLINEDEGLYEERHCFVGGKRSQENSCE